MQNRDIGGALQLALRDTPVVFVQGARQTGKSTLVRSLAPAGGNWQYVTFDDAPVLASAVADPAGFISTLTGSAILDEVQRAPELFRAIKAAVDRDRRPGRFVLTGSANVMLLPRASESLAGRMEILLLWPFSQGEMEGVREGFLDRMFSAEPPAAPPAALTRAQLIGRIVQGGFPEVVTRVDASRRDAWFGSYLSAVVQRDVRDIANIEGITTMPTLLAQVASRCSQLLNLSELSRVSRIPNVTLGRYMTLLQATFLVQLLPAWSSNLGKRLVRSPKLLMADTGLICHLLGLSAQRLLAEPVLLGPVLENFVAMELRKQCGWSQTRAAMFHLRSVTGQEVDIVLEEPGGRCVGIEVKAAASVGAADFKGLKVMAEAIGPKFVRGIVLYLGEHALSFGPNLYALPVESLWRLGAVPNGDSA